MFVYQAGSLPQDFIDKNLEDIGTNLLTLIIEWLSVLSVFPPLHLGFSTLATHTVKEIFAIFEINAEGDFDNFDKMFASLLGPYGTKVFNVFNKNRKLVLHLLNYLHDPAIRYCIQWHI